MQGCICPHPPLLIPEVGGNSRARVAQTVAGHAAAGGVGGRARYRGRHLAAQRRVRRYARRAHVQASARRLRPLPAPRGCLLLRQRRPVRRVAAGARRRLRQARADARRQRRARLGRPGPAQLHRAADHRVAVYRELLRRAPPAGPARAPLRRGARPGHAVRGLRRPLPCAHARGAGALRPARQAVRRRGRSAHGERRLRRPHAHRPDPARGRRRVRPAQLHRARRLPRRRRVRSSLQVLSYEGPFGVGYMVARFGPRPVAKADAGGGQRDRPGL